jgi:tRNA threonylcarbamoyladenosine biosynthesis protein TsaB
VSGPCALAFDAATERLCLAATRDGRVAWRDLDPAREHTARIYEHAADVLAAVGADFAALDVLACGRGPGSFTGVRVAVGAAQALAFALDRPVCRVSSLELLARSAMPRDRPGHIGVVLDARMQRVYAALYRCAADQPPELVGAEQLLRPDELHWPEAVPLLPVGDGWRSYPALLARHPAAQAQAASGLPLARELLSMALEAYAAGRCVPPAAALPEYLGQLPAQPAAATGEPRPHQESAQ